MVGSFDIQLLDGGATVTQLMATSAPEMFVSHDFGRRWQPKTLPFSGPHG
jgi:hypothetical protein